MKLKDIAAMVNGSLVGAGEMEITGVSGISEAGQGDITFLAGAKWLRKLEDSGASAVIVKSLLEGTEKAQIIVKNPQYAFALLLFNFYVKPEQYRGVSPKAFVSEKAEIGEGVTVYPFAYIADGAKIGPGSVLYPGVFIGENSVTGRNCVLHPGVTVREGVTIGNDVVIHAGTVIGSDGFGYVFENGAHQKIPQVGGVVIGDNVEIGANAAIDRATTGNTTIAKGTKIDNLVQVGHNVHIGENAILVAQVAIGGSSEVGAGVMLGGQVGVADHTTIESGAMIGAKSGLMGEVPRGVFSGAPAIPHRDWLKSTAIFATLPEMKKKIMELERKISLLEKKGAVD